MATEINGLVSVINRLGSALDATEAQVIRLTQENADLNARLAEATAEDAPEDEEVN